MTNLAVIEAANAEMEALAIAVAMREARHLNKSAGAGDTEPRAGAARDGGLGRWNLQFDDSGGDALMDTSAESSLGSRPRRWRSNSSRRHCWRC